MAKGLMAVLLLALAGAANAAGNAYFIATVEGELTIGPRGEVLAVALEDADWMGEDVVRGYEQKIRAWRFEPVLEDGKPVNAVGRMSLGLIAVRDDEARTAHFAIRRVYFVDPGPPPAPARGMMENTPRFPASAARNGIGAEVVLVALVGADGEPRELAAEHVHLSGGGAASADARLASQFERASLAAASRWRFDGVPAGGLVRVPIKYTAPGAHAQRSGWQRIHPVARKVPEWLAELRAAEAGVVDLAENGAPSASPLRLLTPPDPSLDG